jgi:hypothetical protein
MEGVDDLRDLWNQQTPFAIPKALQPLFLQRLKDSFAVWDGLDGKSDWTPEALAANANVFLDDFLLFDVAKPITDQSHLEIEKSTLHGRPYQTGGGRTVDANSIDILLTWLVNHDREFLQGGATGATKPGMKVFPYFATPNSEIQTVADSVELSASPNDVWSIVGQFDLEWHPAVARTRLIGEGLGQLRRLETRDGREIVERLAEVDNSKRSYRYTLVSGVPASRYVGVIDVKPTATGSVAEWRVEFLATTNPTASSGPWCRIWLRRALQASRLALDSRSNGNDGIRSSRSRRHPWRDCGDQSGERAPPRMGRVSRKTRDSRALPKRWSIWIF